MKQNKLHKPTPGGTLFQKFCVGKIKKYVSSATLLFFGLFWLFSDFPSVAAPDTELSYAPDAIHIKSVKDLQEFAQNCSSDSWSRDKMFILDKDIDLGRADFSPIPTFGGVFLGQGHTISGLTLENGSNYMGLFRYIQETGEVYQLSVSGTAEMESTHTGLALLAGCNYGLISGCETSGNVTGGDQAGSIAGLNEVTGVITDCTANGLVCGSHLVGGIAGENKGSIANSTNHSFVNTTPSDNNINLSSIDADTALLDILSTENAASVTDIGGVTGINSGVIRACVNDGSIGYQHVGYNIGGIAGSQSGYIEGCVNYGHLNGRKDVGGIAGQMEPSSELIFSEDTLAKLDTEFDKLHDLFTQLDRDTSSASSTLTGQVENLLGSVENAQNAVDRILIDAGNHMAEFSGLTDLSLLPTPRPVSLDFLDKIPTPSFTPWPSFSPWPSSSPWPSFSPSPSSSPWPAETATPSVTPGSVPTPGGNDSENNNGNTGSTGTGGNDSGNTGSTETGGNDGNGTNPGADGNVGNTGTNGNEGIGTTGGSTGATGNGNSDAIGGSTETTGSEGTGNILDSVFDPSTAIPDAGNTQDNTQSDAAKTSDENIQTEQGGFSLRSLFAPRIISRRTLSQDDVNIPNQDSSVQNNGTDIRNPGNGADGNPGDGTDTNPGDGTGAPDGNPDSTPVPTATPEKTPFPFDWPEGFPTPSAGFDFDSLQNRIDKDQVEDDINRVQENVYQDASKVLENINNTIQDRTLVMSSRISSAQTSLNSSFSGIINDMRTLNTLLDDENQIVLNDFQAIIDEINVITDIITNPQGTDPDDILTDISDEDELTDTTGKVMNCINNGKICGDLNVGGIAGSLSRENNLDPENDLDIGSDATLNFRYKERIVVRQCHNKGIVEGKKDCIGGVAGEMTLGSIMECVNEGHVSSDGNMIGGIAGYCASTIRSSSSKCALSGVNQIGGIAGYGTNISDCRSMVDILEGENFTGSIAGKADSPSTVNNNFFVEGCPAGVDGISYESRAQALPYETFLELPDLPDIFENISLTFTADDKTVSIVTLKYGDNFSPRDLPSVPVKEGFAGSWEEFDFNSITYDRTIEAVYTEYISTLESMQTIDGRPVVLVEGSFAPDEGFTLSKVDAYPDDAKTNAECWKISINQEPHGPYTIRYLIPSEMKNPELALYDGGHWTSIDASRDGSYYVFTSSQNEVIFSCTDLPAALSPGTIAILAVCILAALFLLIFIMHTARRRRTARIGLSNQEKASTDR